ncbi:MAG: hypothetical protein LBB47_03370 [Spirochaetaceae bacterium]|nr:hypothetical protein [Spirochaetaceae bacterium]
MIFIKNGIYSVTCGYTDKTGGMKEILTRKGLTGKGGFNHQGPGGLNPGRKRGAAQGIEAE